MFLELTQVVPYVTRCLVKEHPDSAQSAVALCGLDTLRLSLEKIQEKKVQSLCELSLYALQ